MKLEPLDPLSKELVDAARDGHVPTPGGRERVRGRIVASIGTAAFAHSALAAATTRWLKAGAAFSVLAVGIGGAYLALHRQRVDVAPPVVIQSQPIAAPPATTSSAPPALAVAPDPPPQAAVRRAPPQPVPSQQQQQEAPSIGAETALLLDAQSALRAGDTTKALSLLDEHEKRFPAGALAEERQASRVLALCAAGRTTEARDVARAFLAEHPRSPAAIRVRSSCGGSD